MNPTLIPVCDSCVSSGSRSVTVANIPHRFLLPRQRNRGHAIAHQRAHSFLFDIAMRMRELGAIARHLSGVSHCVTLYCARSASSSLRSRERRDFARHRCSVDARVDTRRESSPSIAQTYCRLRGWPLCVPRVSARSPGLRSRHFSRREFVLRLDGVVCSSSLFQTARWRGWRQLIAGARQMPTHAKVWSAPTKGASLLSWPSPSRAR